MTGGKRGEGLIREGHGETRTFLRIGGPATLVVAAVLIIIGGIKMFSGDPSVEMGDDGWFEAQTRASFTGFALAAGGLILLAVGVSMTKFGYMGAVARYSASEVAP
ncbi:MAG: hypothetical protein KY455_09030, partial [Euryarchaeota archaeon]|nr:hypothetical protein [Euryarchaeota archaeon]